MAENSANGTIVGQLSAVDPDASDTATYTLVDDAGGRFAIDGSNIVVAGSLDYETATSHQVTVRVTDGGGNTYDEIFTVNVGNVSGNFTGTSAGESLPGTSEEDTIQALGGNDTLQGLAGDDTLNGDAGGDRAVYADATGGITVDLAAGTVSGAGVGTDTLLSVENITGSDFADSYNAFGFSGSSPNSGSNGTLNSFEGMGGNDTITGNGSTLLFYTAAAAGVTADLIAGTAQGTDQGDVAGVGIDTFTGVTGLRGSNYNDTLLGSNTTSAVEQFFGEGGDDLIDGRGGLDRVIYASILNDTVTGGINVDMASGVVTGDASVGTDTLRSIEFVRGSQFDDVYVATGFSGSSTNAGSNGTFNEFEGVGGNDTITGNGNTRIAFYNATAGVTVDLAAGTATGDASVGSDTFTGVNNIAGSQFADTLYGSNNAAGHQRAVRGPCRQRRLRRSRWLRHRSLQQRHRGERGHHCRHGGRHGDRTGGDRHRYPAAHRGDPRHQLRRHLCRDRLQRVQHQCRQPAVPSTSSRAWAATTPSPATAIPASPSAMQPRA